MLQSNFNIFSFSSILKLSDKWTDRWTNSWTTQKDNKSGPLCWGGHKESSFMVSKENYTQMFTELQLKRSNGYNIWYCNNIHLSETPKWSSSNQFIAFKLVLKQRRYFHTSVTLYFSLNWLGCDDVSLNYRQDRVRSISQYTPDICHGESGWLWTLHSQCSPNLYVHSHPQPAVKIIVE